MKTNYTNEQLQNAIDAACKAAHTQFNAKIGNSIAISPERVPACWGDEYEARLHLLKTALDLLPDTLPPVVKAEQADPYAELKAAHAAGKVIQSYNRERSLWQDCPSPAFEGGTDYRIKPEQADPYAELKAAHAAGKVIQILNAQNRYVDAYPTWHSPPEAYRIKPEPEVVTAEPWTPKVGDVVQSNPIQVMALGGQMYWRDLARQLTEVWWKCHNIGASLQHGDIDTDVSFSIVCEKHGGQVFHADTPHNAWLKAEKWLMSPDRANFPLATLQPA